jgi:hypothetical protein
VTPAPVIAANVSRSLIVASVTAATSIGIISRTLFAGSFESTRL